MPDWRGKDDDDDYDVREDHSNRKHRGRRHGRGSKEFGDTPEFGVPEDFGVPLYTGDFGRGQDYNGGPRAPARADSRPDSRHDGGGPRGDVSPRPAAPRAPAGDPPASQEERGPRQLGTVKFFKGDKGFGFITPDSGETDVFVHISAVERSGLTGLDSGQRISFETEPDRRGKGPKAVELQVVEGDAA
ncbi:cold-shock protein [Breoghania sp. L-A4]|uniref:cold-shock protein n=1 Tax=Breoghania sp. L-A4 TaxID=2304600 RepID=UPI001967221A|nr:cold-shock protein [Breoghania sp. L-A4]